MVDYGPTTCYQGGTPQYLATIDLAGVLAAPRVAGTHTVSSTYDLAVHGLVSFVPTH